MKGTATESECTDIAARRSTRERIQSLASAGKISADQMAERLVRTGLEAYLAAQKEVDSGQRQGV
jgi:hypothetical protein